MSAKYVDVTSLLVGARNNHKVALERLAKKFADGRFLVPLRTTKDVRNAPESLKEHGTELPAHYLSLADGRTGAVFFTSYKDADLVEKELSWRTDNRGLKCLCVPGKLMADHAEALFDAGVIDRVILNPGGPNETHLSQGDLAAFGKGQPPSALSFHVGEIPLPSSMPPGLVDSLADVAISKADSFIKKVTKHLETLSSPVVSAQSNWSSSTTKSIVIGDSDRLNTVVNQLFTVFSKLPPDPSMPGLQVTVDKVGDDVEVEANRPVPDELMNEAYQAVKTALAEGGNLHIKVDLSMTQLFGGNGIGAPIWTPPVAPAASPKNAASPKKPATRASTRSQQSRGRRGPRKLDYIPLEPESSDKSGE